MQIECLNLLKNEDKDDETHRLHRILEQNEERAGYAGDDRAVNRDQRAEDHDDRDHQRVGEAQNQHPDKA